MRNQDWLRCTIHTQRKWDSRTILENACIDKRLRLYGQQTSSSIVGLGNGYRQLLMKLVVNKTYSKLTIIIPEET